MKKVHKDKKKRRRFTGPQPGTKSGRRPADKPLINRLSTACQPVIVFLHRFYIGFPLFVLPKNRSRQLSSMPQKPHRTAVFWANRPVGYPSYRTAAPLHRRAPPRPDPPVVCPGFGFDRSFRTCVFDALGGKRDGCLLGEPTRRRPVLPGPARPRRAPPRPDTPAVCPGFGLDKLLKYTHEFIKNTRCRLSH